MYMNRIPWVTVALMAACVLAVPQGHAADSPAQTACAPLSLLPVLKDVDVTTLDVRARGGRCQVVIEAASVRALSRQQQLVDAISQAACGAAAEASADRRGLPGLLMRLPADCQGVTSAALFGDDASTWNPPRAAAPRYPPAAAEQGLQGRSTVVVIIDNAGRVAATILRESSGYAVLDEAAVADVQRWRFTRADPTVAAPTFTIAKIPMRYVLD